MASGGLVKIRVDMLSERPHATGNFQLQGTKGCYEAARERGGVNRVWLADICDEKNEWIDLTDLEEDYLPDMWRNPSERSIKSRTRWGRLFRNHGFYSKHQRRNRLSNWHPRGHGHDLAGINQPTVNCARRSVVRRTRLALVDRGVKHGNTKCY